ncbi:MAG: response regulator [Desulfomonile tiedjei]|nr:response regulator [Desulfomonile tiedjei]
MKVKRFLKKLLPSGQPPDESIKSVLVVDDDGDLTDNLTDILEAEGYEVFSAASSSQAVRAAREVRPWVALVDLKLPDGSGTALLSELKRVKSETVCIMMTAHADVDSAVMALEKGAFYYLRKPVKPDELIELVELAFETLRIKEEKRVAEEALRARNKELEEIIARLKNTLG